MVDPTKLDDPTNRVVCIFDKQPEAAAAVAELEKVGFSADRIKMLRGSDDADRLETTAKWFADTDKEMKRFERELQHGKTVVAVSIHDSETREKVHHIVKAHQARHVTHFGEWITEVLK